MFVFSVNRLVVYLDEFDELATVVSLKYFISTITHQTEDNRNKKHCKKKKTNMFYPIFIFYFHNFFLFSIKL
jgi:CRISPR/Cas system-associated protein Csx1